MLLLSIETSTPLGSLSLIKNNCLIDSISWDKAESHSEKITIYAKDLLEKNKFKFSDLTALGFGIGPGSFTGVRVGLSFVKSLAYSLKIPVLAPSSLELLAAPALQKHKSVFCAQSAFRNLVYIAEYSRGPSGLITKLSPMAVTISDLAKYLSTKTLVLGEAFDQHHSELSQTFVGNSIRDNSYSDRPKSSAFAEWMQLSENELHFLPWNQVVPLYVRASEAEEKLRQGVIKPL
jgi:tRNA threonylcarbamoyladenosine biosynthesis protein TsaB